MLRWGQIALWLWAISLVWFVRPIVLRSSNERCAVNAGIFLLTVCSDCGFTSTGARAPAVGSES